MAAMRPTRRRAGKPKPAPPAPSLTVANYYRAKLRNPNGSRPSWAEYRTLAGVL